MTTQTSTASMTSRKSSALPPPTNYGVKVEESGFDPATTPIRFVEKVGLPLPLCRSIGDELLAGRGCRATKVDNSLHRDNQNRYCYSEDREQSASCGMKFC